MLAIHDACRRYADSGGVQDATPYERAYQEEFARQMTTAAVNRNAGHAARPMIPWGYGSRRYR
jgi:hypothetical protein